MPMFSKNIDTFSEEVDEKRYRNFMFLLYQDTTTYNFDDVLFDLKGSFKNYAYIKHLPESDEKKEHYHFILSLDNARSVSSLSKRVGVPNNYISPIRSLRASCRYLTHQDNEDKTKYNLTDVVVSSSFARKFFGAFDDLKTEQDIIEDIYNYIDYVSQFEMQKALKELIIFVNQNAYDSIYKRYRYEFLDYLKDMISMTVGVRSSTSDNIYYVKL